ncbi:UNVERIFIED_CONTAM: hypothetical protein PYX00_001491 [Menopon gallinae]|uniref:Secreted phosphoprotein 1 n=1 Tax=Menopon gallinae TaxID=328185 RepID=A0AAW2IEB9_9NEOP
MFVSVWTTLFVTSLIVCGKCGPIDETSTTNRYDEKQTTVLDMPSSSPSEEPTEKTTQESGKDTSTTEGVATVERRTADFKSDLEQALEFVNGEPHSSNIEKKQADFDEDDDDDDDDFDDDDEEDFREEHEDHDKKKRITFVLTGNRKKRQTGQDGGDGSENSEPNAAQKTEDGEIMEAVSDSASTQFFDYDPRDKRDSTQEKGTETPVQILGMLRRRRQTGETVPYTASNRSRRDNSEASANETSTEGGETVTEEPENTSQPGEIKEDETS